MPDQLPAPQITVWFVLAGDDFDADACTAAIGLSPASIWRQKRPELRDHPDLNNMNWSFGAEKVSEYSTNTVVASVLKDVWQRRDAIAAFASQHALTASVCCNITIYQERPVYQLSPDVMRKLADLDAVFLMDIFDYSD